MKADLISHFGDFPENKLFSSLQNSISSTVKSSKIRRCLKYSPLLHDTLRNTQSPRHKRDIMFQRCQIRDCPVVVRVLVLV